MIDLGRLIETADHALFLLDELASHVPGAEGVVLKSSVESIRTAFNSVGVRAALKEVQDKYSAEAQKIADEWRNEPTAK